MDQRSQTPHLTEKVKGIDCNVSNYVPFVVPGLPRSSRATPTPTSSSTQLERLQEVRTATTDWEAILCWIAWCLVVLWEWHVRITCWATERRQLLSRRLLVEARSSLLAEVWMVKKGGAWCPKWFRERSSQRSILRRHITPVIQCGLFWTLMRSRVCWVRIIFWRDALPRILLYPLCTTQRQPLIFCWGAIRKWIERKCGCCGGTCLRYYAVDKSTVQPCLVVLCDRALPSSLFALVGDRCSSVLRLASIDGSESQDSVFDETRYSENPVPGSSGSTREELQGNLQHKPTESENKKKDTNK